MTQSDAIVLGRVLCMTNDKIHQNQEVYSIDGIMCTLKATHYKDPPKVLIDDSNLFYNTK